MNTLRIYFSSTWRDHTSPCEWAVCNDTNEVIQQGLSALSAIPKIKTCLAIIAADRVSILSVPRPPGNPRRWHSALPFIAEEHTLSDPEEIHVVPAQGITDNQISLLVIDKSWLKQIISATNACGLPLGRVVTETLLPALQPRAWTLVWNGLSGFMRTSTTTGLTLSANTPTTIPLGLRLNLQDAAANPPEKIEFRRRNSTAPAELPEWSLDVPVAIGANWFWQQAVIPNDTPNLLWGELTPPLRIFDWLPKLRPALFILLAAITIEMLGTNIEWALLAQEKRELAQKMAQVFRSTFGDNAALVNPPLQMQRNLASLRHAVGISDNADFLALLDVSANALGDQKHLQLQNMSYEAGKLELTVKLTGKNELPTMEQQLNQAGLKVRISERVESGEGIQAKLTLSPEALQ